MRKKIITTIVMIGMFLLVVANVSALDLTLKLEPSKLNLTGEPNTEICQNLKIEYSVYNGLVEGRDLWAQKGVTDKNLSLHTLDAEDLGLIVTYPKSVNILGSGDVDVCITGPEGLYHGALLYRTIQGGSVGIELNVWITVDIKEEDNNLPQDNDESSDSTGGSGSSSGRSGGRGSSGGSSFSSGSTDFINLEDTGAEIIGGVINLGTSEGDENNKGGGFLIIIPIILLILIALIVILSVKKSKKKVLST